MPACRFSGMSRDPRQHICQIDMTRVAACRAPKRLNRCAGLSSSNSFSVARKGIVRTPAGPPACDNLSDASSDSGTVMLNSGRAATLTSMACLFPRLTPAAFSSHWPLRSCRSANHRKSRFTFTLRQVPSNGCSLRDSSFASPRRAYRLMEGLALGTRQAFQDRALRRRRHERPVPFAPSLPHVAAAHERIVASLSTFQDHIVRKQPFRVVEYEPALEMELQDPAGRLSVP